MDTINIEVGNIGSSKVNSVNGKTGNVVLTASDVGALPSSTVIPTKTSDLTNDSGFLTEHQSLAGYATEQWVGQQGYLTEHQSLASYRTAAAQDIIDSNKQPLINDLSTIRSGAQAGATAVQPAEISDMASKTWVNNQGYLTSHQSLTGYATEQWVENKNYLTEHQSLSGYATENWVNNQGYLTQHQSLTAYRTSANQDVIDNGKQATLVSGTNIKTINNQSLLGSGNIEIQGGGATYTAGDGINIANNEISVNNTIARAADIPTVPTNVSAFTNDAGYLTEHQSLSAYRTSANQDTIDAGKQATLVSGTNIKTINNQSILGSGNITITGSSDFYWCTYNSTSYNEVLTAYNNGQIPVLKNNSDYYFASYDSATHNFLFVEVPICKYYNSMNVGYITTRMYTLYSSGSWSESARNVNIQKETNFISQDFITNYNGNNNEISLKNRIPTLPTTGTYVLKCINGSMSWVAE